MRYSYYEAEKIKNRLLEKETNYKAVYSDNSYEIIPKSYISFYKKKNDIKAIIPV